VLAVGRRVGTERRVPHGVPIAAYVIGNIAECGGNRRLATAFLAYIAGQLIIWDSRSVVEDLDWPRVADRNSRGVRDLHRRRPGQGRRRSADAYRADGRKKAMMSDSISRPQARGRRR
jgi:hypothetical protein